MPLPSITDLVHDYLFADEDVMQRNGVPQVQQVRLQRLRGAYTYWQANPTASDAAMVALVRKQWSVSDTTARTDLALVKNLLGDFNRVSRDWMRFRTTAMLEAAYERAAQEGDTRDMIAAAKELGRIHRLENEDSRADLLGSLVPVTLTFTDDPSVLGLPRVPDVKEKIAAMKQKYGGEEMEYIDFEDIDADLDGVFSQPHTVYGDPTATAGISE